ncbi:hypothetical protein LT493_12460 [Streptomyces tricolor]|nr:hypothetical protein [Streptomyces tricolor]
MVGLFWIAEGDVYVGAKPAGLAPGVRLDPGGRGGPRRRTVQPLPVGGRGAP